MGQREQLRTTTRLPVGLAGEIGPIQIRPGAVSDLGGAGILPAQWNTDLTANLTAGALYYARLSDHHNIPAVNAAMAYNGGLGNYQRGTISQDARNYQRVFDIREAAFSQMVNCIRGF